MPSFAKIDRWLDASGIPRNNVAQVVQNVMTDVFSVATSGGAGENDVFWYRIPPLTTVIKPYDIRSKILVMLDIHMGSTYWEIQGRIKRNGEPIGLGDKRGARVQCTFIDNNYEWTPSAQYSQYSIYKSSVILLDTPNLGTDVTSATYEVFLNPYSSNTLFVNKAAYDNNDTDYWGAPISTMTLMEITQ